MRNAFGDYSVKNITTLDDSVHDRRVFTVMKSHGLDEFIRSDGVTYPVVAQLSDGRKVQKFSCLDPYTDYSSTCVVTVAKKRYTLPGGWRIHISGNGRNLIPDSF